MDLLLSLFMEVPVKQGGQFPTWFTAVYVVGFLAAVSIGSIAWYNSKRPVGWEDKARPDIVPEIKDTENPGV
ncbi:hypothetical protein OsccyDRAFT_4517 [Leptolyngbyaceae cyanobacterium JSC-12]|nr:hypothetical protein OsccyDRAFT_4517 [Leptolyngbyaceae cyanobacterium JSC-12]